MCQEDDSAHPELDWLLRSPGVFGVLAVPRLARRPLALNFARPPDVCSIGDCAAGEAWAVGHTRTRRLFS